MPKICEWKYDYQLVWKLALLVEFHNYSIKDAIKNVEHWGFVEKGVVKENTLRRHLKNLEII